MGWLDGLIEGALDLVGDGVELTQQAIDEAVHRAAVGLLDAVLPPMIHGADTVVKTVNRPLVHGAAAIVRGTLGVAQGSGTVLTGMVEKKVDSGITTIRGHGDYTRGVESIA